MKDNYTVQFTGPAVDDLEKIKKYLIGYSSAIYNSFRKEFIEKINLLETQPKIFEIIPGRTSIQYRRFFIKNYAVIYDVDDEKKMITVDRIYHCKEDYLNRYYQYK